TGDDAMITLAHEREVRDGDDARSRIATRRAERVELLEVRGADAGLFLQLATRGFFERLALIAVVRHVHESARQGPRSFERRLPALHEQHAERAFTLGVEAEDHAVDGQRRPRPAIRVGHSYWYNKP